MNPGGESGSAVTSHDFTSDAAPSEKMTGSQIVGNDAIKLVGRITRAVGNNDRIPDIKLSTTTVLILDFRVMPDR